MKIYRLSTNDLFDIFDYSEEEKKKIKNRKIVSTDEPKREETTLKLYRGFNYLPPLQNGKYIFSPEQSEQKVLWFTHNFIRGYRAKDYAKSHGKFLLTYDLNCWIHYQEYTYNTGETFRRTPENIDALEQPLENSKYHMGYELPDGWFFSYKNEKFIISENPITVFPNQIEKVEEEE